MRAAVVLVFVLIASGTAFAQSHEWSAHVSLEPRVFPESPAYAEQPGNGLSWSAAFAAEFRHQWGEGRNRLAIEPFIRIDQHDSERTHADLREASWLHVNEPWTLRVGLSRVFWGVTESRHLVDIVNQTDLVEDIDGEAKLGQPMIHLERWTESGTFGVFLLPGFRERTFPADDARLRGPLPIATDLAQYESGARDRRLDLAARWAQVLGPWDLGLSAFYGNSREPRFIPVAGDGADAVLVPRYDVITQLGADVQHTRGAWLWKLETIVRRGHGDRFAALVAGFEHTFFSLAGGPADLGVLFEYLHDGRDARSPPVVFGNDGAFVGLRLALNDPDSMTLLAGVLVDRKHDGTFAVIEAERRLGDAWKVELEARVLSDIDRGNQYLSGFRKDSFLTLRATRYF